jgi:hypothetical protein
VKPEPRTGFVAAPPRTLRAVNRQNTLRTPHLRALGRAIERAHLAKLPPPSPAPARTIFSALVEALEDLGAEVVREP